MDNIKMDVHMHFDIYEDRDSIVNYINKSKTTTIAVTNLPEIYKRYIGKYKDTEYFKLALGFHPELCVEYREQLKIFIQCINTTRFIGEVGLDFSNANKIDRDVQKQIFKKIVELCSRKNKVLNIHSRKAEEEVMDILKEFEGTVILHWYSGKLTLIDEAIKRGYYFSINHNMIKSVGGKKIIGKIPINRILIESDAPYTTGLYTTYNNNFANEIYAFLSLLYSKNINEISKDIHLNLTKLLNS